MNSNRDSRQCRSNKIPEVTPCRGGMRFSLQGINSKGKPQQVTVFIDHAFIPGLVNDISYVAQQQREDMASLVSDITEAAKEAKP